ncbi:DUF4215 domain-containing protein [Myxococcota bacterium]|nr:DUF4215 domain-containing protein [Myxococcota bacterium]
MKTFLNLLVMTLTIGLVLVACDEDKKTTNNVNNVNNLNNVNNAVCGDSTVDETEDCDDGEANANEPDACRADCTHPVCGDAILDVLQAYGVEECDNGEANADEPNVCRTNCLNPFCGDSILDDEFFEECDYGDGNADAPNVCRQGCINPACGDGIIDFSLVWGEETCDDGDTDAEDGCNGSCKIELGWSCQGQPSVCTDGCGDGLINGSEECDNETDFIPNSGDGCSATCRVEVGWACSGEPSNCTPICGDNLRVGPETDALSCDDGDTEPNDGCDGNCLVEEGWTCTGTPSVCIQN